jgi:beta-phosphoglucomutase
MRYEAVIFDLDGVICHTDKYHYEAWKAISDKLIIYFDENINNRLRGVSRMESFNIILEKYDGVMSEEDKAKYSEEKNEIYKKLLNKMSTDDLSEEVKNTLVELRNKGVKLAIGSSSKNAKFILNQLGLGDFFDAISDGNNITKSKPDPEVFLKAAEYLGVSSEKCMVVEDAIAGLEAAISGGMDSAAIGEAVFSKRATYNLNSFSDLLKIIGMSRNVNKLREDL